MPEYLVRFKDGSGVRVSSKSESAARRYAIQMRKEHIKYTGDRKVSTEVKDVEANPHGIGGQ